MLSFADTSFPIVVLLGENLFLSASFPVKTLEKRKTHYNMTKNCQAFHTNYQQTIFLNALGDLWEEDKTTGALSSIYKYLWTNFFSQRTWIVFVLSIKLARKFSCCLAFQRDYLTEKWYTVSETMLRRVQTVCMLLRNIKVILTAYLLLSFPENQWLETDTIFLALRRCIPSDNLPCLLESFLPRLLHNLNTSTTPQKFLFSSHGKF